MNTTIFPLSVNLLVSLNLVELICSRNEDISKTRLCAAIHVFETGTSDHLSKNYEVLLLPAKWGFHIGGRESKKLTFLNDRLGDKRLYVTLPSISCPSPSPYSKAVLCAVERLCDKL